MITVQEPVIILGGFYYTNFARVEICKLVKLSFCRQSQYLINNNKL